MVEILQIAELEHVLISSVYVVVQFYPWFNFYFPLFLCMVIYDNEYKVKENKNWTKDKTELQYTQESALR